MSFGRIVYAGLCVALAPLTCIDGSSAESGVEWAYPSADAVQPASDDSTLIRIPGSDRSYFLRQIDDLKNPPDWFPEEHPGPPRVVAHGGSGGVLACASCHLTSGRGHPESADIAGLPVSYLKRQLEAFRNGSRHDAARMNGIAADLTDEEIEQAAEWYAHLPAGSWIRVVTCERVPSSYVNKGRMRIPHSIDGLAYEPLGNRIVELPENSHRAVARDPRSGFVAYVPSGAIERGRDLIEHVPREHACAACHGERLQGASDVPRLAGLSALYVTRQLAGFRNGERREPRSEQMAIVVAEMTPDEMLAISAYLASLNPTQAAGNTATETVTPRDERRPCD